MNENLFFFHSGQPGGEQAAQQQQQPVAGGSGLSQQVAVVPQVQQFQLGPRPQMPAPFQQAPAGAGPRGWAQPQGPRPSQATLPPQQPQKTGPRVQAPQQQQQQTSPSKAQAPQQQKQKKGGGQQQQLDISSSNRRGAQAGAMRPPPRPGAGTLGKPISLSANHFALTVKSTTLYHYDIDIKPETPKTLFKYVFFIYFI